MSHGALATCPMEPSQHVPWSPRNMSHGALATCPMEPSQHVPWSPRNMCHGALATCPMEPSQHVPWSPRNMSLGAVKMLVLSGLWLSYATYPLFSWLRLLCTTPWKGWQVLKCRVLWRRYWPVGVVLLCFPSSFSKVLSLRSSVALPAPQVLLFLCVTSKNQIVCTTDS